MTDRPDLSIIIPANNEGALIGQCLTSVLASVGPPNVQIIVAANGCTDDTEDRARAFVKQATQRGWQLEVLSLPQGNKLLALNAADQAATGRARVYLDADVTVDPALMGQLSTALTCDAPRYASGTIRFTPPKTLATRAYARTYARVPFIANGLPGAGLFAVNDAGRRKWGKFPDIISDDTYIRLLFTPQERLRVPAPYEWPLVEGYKNLIRVRRRQNAGVEEIKTRFPELLANDDKLPLDLKGKFKLFVRDPFSFAVYASVQLIVKLTPARTRTWERGR